MAAGDGAQLPATVAASRSVEKALEEAAASGALNLSNRKLKEFPRSARNYDLSDITHAAQQFESWRELELKGKQSCYGNVRCKNAPMDFTKTLKPHGIVSERILSARQQEGTIDSLQTCSPCLPAKSLPAKNELASIVGCFQVTLWTVIISSVHRKVTDEQDLSKNRLCELPEELCQFISLETLSLYHNGMRSLSSSLGNLQALTYLNLSRNLLSSLPPSVFQLPLLRVLIVSNNKLCSLPASIFSLTHLRQLDVSCNELQCLPAELGQLECLRDLNLRRNQLTTLPEEISELPLVRLDVSCNRISHVPLCYRHLRHLQSIQLDNNPLQMPPAQICSKGKYHIFKYLNMEACKRSQEELERHLRPTGFNSCLSDQELFTGQFGGLDSGFNSVDSGSKRWSGNESADDFSERSLRMAEVSRDQRNLEEEEEEDGSPLEVKKVNGEAEHVDFIDSSVTEEEEEEIRMDPPTPPFTAPPLVQPPRGGVPPIVELLLSPVPLQPQPGGEEEAGHAVHLAGERASAAAAERKGQWWISRELPLRPPAAMCNVPSSPKTSSPPGQAQKPNSFLFRTSSRSNVKPTGTIFTLGESGRSESRTMLRSPKEERPDITQLRKTLESRLKITLPEDLGEALSNGTILCQLVNHIRPRSVSIIHIPSPAVPKLSSAKCRLNVENFIVACRKLGVPETDVCVCSDVLLCKLPAVLRCVTALLAVEVGEPAEDQSPRLSSPSSSSSSSSSLLSTDFLLFYCAAMALLYVLYCYLLT
ncbi:Leucine-rich repeat and calponin-like proteiny domain-containing protein 1 [Nibea albiflora]|uniref:Leucine-rich repeat and calponin-like proteiny domain-containing protein 1 n=1 Tax=Nibea albiflora TaxID=240163 RepID=A0ACB7EX20_NIBAL|nr:Leucine-rich repeat and calponin-like proteiny domain-containing protein 1 [Nibea albiflora]